MTIAILIMHREGIVQELMNKFIDPLGICLIHEPKYNNASKVIHKYSAKVALVEVIESGKYDMDYCLTLCGQLRKDNPQCKLLVMCSEQNEQSVTRVVEAKGKKEIDDFVFYDVTIDYLASKLNSI